MFADQGNTVLGFWQLGGAVLLYGASMWDAHTCLANGDSTLPRKLKNAWYSVFLSQLLPGLGHLYLERPLLGGVFLLSGVGLAYCANNYAPVLLPLAYTIWSLAGYHAYRIAPKPKPKTMLYGVSHSNSKVAALIVVGVMLIRVAIGYTPIWINQAVLQCIVPSESMLPTLHVGDRMFVSRNRFYRPATGDIIVFRAPTEAIVALDANPNTLFVKRVVGLPGQQIRVNQDGVWVDQQLLTESYATQPSYQWGPEIVPPGTYFVLGDNRDYSADSRVWGFLPQADVLGEAYKIYWPPDRIQSLLSF